MDEYHVDGFRFDLTKGFVQNTNGDEYAYNQERIDILKDYYYTIISSFANLCDLVGRRQIVLRKNKIKIDNMTYKLNLYTYKGDFDKNKSEVKLGLTEITGEELKMKEEEAKIKKK